MTTSNSLSLPDIFYFTMSSITRSTQIEVESPVRSQSSVTTSMANDLQREDNLFNTIEQLICQFMGDNNRRHPYWTRVRWFYDDGTQLAYHVSLSIQEDTPSSS